MIPLVVDASVAVKWFVEEEWRHEAARLLPHLARHHAPEFVEVEFANILWKKVRRNELSADHARTIIPLLRSYIPNLHSQETLLATAIEIGFSIDHSIYDCIYLACVEKLHGRLVTADQKLCARVAGTAMERSVVHVRYLSQATMLTLPDYFYDEVVRISGNHFDTKAGLSVGRFADAARTDSLNGWRLAELLVRLGPLERGELLAVALLGRGSDGMDWERIQIHAQTLCEDVPYMVRALQPAAILAGLDTLRSMPI